MKRNRTATFLGLAITAGVMLTAGAAVAAPGGAFTPALGNGIEQGSALELATYGRRCWRVCHGPPWRRWCEVRCAPSHPHWQHWRRRHW